MRIILLILGLCIFQTSSAQVNVTIDPGIYLIGDSSLDMVIDSGSLTNDGKYINSAGSFIAVGGITFNGSGITDLYDLNIDNTGTNTINSLVSVFNTANLVSGNLNANNKLFIRSDAGNANLIVSGVLTGNVKGLVERAPVVSARCSLSAHLSLNISGAPVLYQWQSSSDSASWSNLGGATSGVYTASVTTTSYYRCHLTASNSGYDEFTPGVKLAIAYHTVVPSVSIISSGDTVCPNTYATFTATSVNGGPTPLYEWDVNGAVAGSGSSFHYKPSNGDTVSVLLTSSAPCPSVPVTSSSAAMTVDTTAVPIFTISSSPAGSIAPGQYDTLTAILTNSGFSPAYQWVVNGSYVAGATSATYISNSFFDDDSVICYVVNNGACGEVISRQVFVIHLQNIGIKNVVSQNGISLFPNPNNGAFTVSGSLPLTADAEISLSVKNMLGQEVFTDKRTVRNGVLNEQIDLGHKLPGGAYMLNVTSGNDRATLHFVIH